MPSLPNQNIGPVAGEKIASGNVIPLTNTPGYGTEVSSSFYVLSRVSQIGSTLVTEAFDRQEELLVEDIFRLKNRPAFDDFGFGEIAMMGSKGLTSGTPLKERSQRHVIDRIEGLYASTEDDEVVKKPGLIVVRGIFGRFRSGPGSPAIVDSLAQAIDSPDGPYVLGLSAVTLQVPPPKNEDYPHKSFDKLVNAFKLGIELDTNGEVRSETVRDEYPGAVIAPKVRHEAPEPKTREEPQSEPLIETKGFPHQGYTQL